MWVDDRVGGGLREEWRGGLGAWERTEELRIDLLRVLGELTSILP